MKLKLNHSKTEYILIVTPQQLAKCTNMAINIGGNEIHALSCVRNLGGYFDNDYGTTCQVQMSSCLCTTI